MTRQTIKEIKEALLGIEEETDYIKELRQDSRAGVQQALKQWDKRQLAKETLRLQFEEKNRYEVEAYNKGYQLIAGIDEVGRGPLAGPVVCAAVILDPNQPILGLNDSKKLSEKKRLALFEEIKQKAVAIETCEASPAEIDQYNIYEATRRTMKQTIEQLAIQPDFLLVDAMTIDVPIKQQSLIKGDLNSNSIAAASIIAKVTRDEMMKAYATEFPHYDFEHNMGYGTKKHLDGLKTYGYTSIHRQSFEPVKSMVENNQQ